MKCYFCDVAERKSWGGYFCESCENMQSITKVYGTDRILEIMKTICLRNEEQLEKKLKTDKTIQEKPKVDKTKTKPHTRSTSNT